jgi:hypothetical protein
VNNEKIGQMQCWGKGIARNTCPLTTGQMFVLCEVLSDVCQTARRHIPEKNNLPWNNLKGERHEETEGSTDGTERKS